MTNIIDWITGLGFTMPGLSWMKYVLGIILVLIIIDAFLSLLFASIHTLFTGGKR